MDRSQLLKAFRQGTQDKVQPYLIDDSEAYQLLDDAQIEAARRTRWLVDSASSFCTINVTANKAAYPLDSRIIKIRRIRFNGENITPLDVRELDATSSWEADTGMPRHFVTGMGHGQIRLYPIPEAAGKLSLTVEREPLESLVEGADPELPARSHQALVQGAIAAAFLIPDTELFDEGKAVKAQAQFDKEFSPALEQANLSDEAWFNDQAAYLPKTGWR